MPHGYQTSKTSQKTTCVNSTPSSSSQDELVGFHTTTIQIQSKEFTELKQQLSALESKFEAQTSTNANIETQLHVLAEGLEQEQAFNQNKCQMIDSLCESVENIIKTVEKTQRDVNGLQSDFALGKEKYSSLETDLTGMQE